MDPLLAFGFWAFVLTFAGIYAIFVLGLQLEVGDTGLINFGHVAFMAIGAYTMGLLVTNDVIDLDRDRRSRSRPRRPAACCSACPPCDCAPTTSPSRRSPRARYSE